MIPVLGDTPVKDLTVPVVRDFMATLEKDGATPPTRVSALKVLRAMCLTARQDGILTTNPAAGLKVRASRAREMTTIPSEPFGIAPLLL
jgi:hypothetical protein